MAFGDSDVMPLTAAGRLQSVSSSDFSLLTASTLSRNNADPNFECTRQLQHVEVNTGMHRHCERHRQPCTPPFYGDSAIHTTTAGSAFLSLDIKR